MNDIFIEFLKNLAPFSEVELKQALPFFKTVTIKKNDFFLKAGHLSDRIGFVKSGFLRSFIDMKNKETTIFFALPGSIILDLHSYLQNKPCRESIQALEYTELEIISKNDLYFLYNGNWKWQQVGRLLLEFYFITTEERAINLQCLTASELYEKFIVEYPEVIKTVPLNYIASYLGITPETLSRVRGNK
jgi:CRP-like cAMP-binding protein